MTRNWEALQMLEKPKNQQQCSRKKENKTNEIQLNNSGIL